MYEKIFCLVCMGNIKIYESFFLLLSKFALLILHLSLEPATRCVLKKVVFINIAIFTVVAIFNLLLKRQLSLIIKIKLC